MQKLMLHRYSVMAIEDGLYDDEVADMIRFELELLEQNERYEECALLRDVIKIWNDLHDDK